MTCFWTLEMESHVCKDSLSHYPSSETKFSKRSKDLTCEQAGLLFRAWKRSKNKFSFFRTSAPLKLCKRKPSCLQLGSFDDCKYIAVNKKQLLQHQTPQCRNRKQGLHDKDIRFSSSILPTNGTSQTNRGKSSPVHLWLLLQLLTSTVNSPTGWTSFWRMKRSKPTSAADNFAPTPLKVCAKEVQLLSTWLLFECPIHTRAREWLPNCTLHLKAGNMWLTVQ